MIIAEWNLEKNSLYNSTICAGFCNDQCKRAIITKPNLQIKLSSSFRTISPDHSKHLMTSSLSQKKINYSIFPIVFKHENDNWMTMCYNLHYLCFKIPNHLIKHFLKNALVDNIALYD